MDHIVKKLSEIEHAAEAVVEHASFFLSPDERISCAHSSNKRKPANKSTEKCDILFKMWFCFK